MNRRQINTVVAASALATALGPLVAQSQTRRATGPRIGMIVHPDMILLDLIAPLTVFSIMMADAHLVWKSREPVLTDVGIPIVPTATLDTCPSDLDVLFVPGGLKGSIALMEDRPVLDFLADRGSRARYVTSVCTGSLVLGAAGLLRGYRATSHWYVRDLLPLMGATMATDRVVVDRNRVTGGGATAGVDYGLTVCAAMMGEEYAKRIQLVLEYQPVPPFKAGEPETAGPALVSDVLARRGPLLAAAKAAAAKVSERLR